MGYMSVLYGDIDHVIKITTQTFEKILYAIL